MGEVEAQLVRPDVGAGLTDVRAEPLAQRGVQQVSCGVIAHRREARRALDARPDRLARAEISLHGLERERLVLAEPVHVDHPGAAGRRLYDAGVGHLPAALRVEGRLLELGEHPAVAALGHPQNGVRLGGLVAHEARAEARLAREPRNLLVLNVHLVAGARDRGRLPAPRHLAGLLHQLLEALVVHGQALLREQLPGHLVGEAIGVVKLEGVVGGNPGRLLLPGAPDQVGQQPLALLQGPAEALLLGPRPALDGGPFARQLGVGLAHHIHHGRVELRQEGLLEAEHSALLNRAAHDPAEDVAPLFVRGHHAVGHQEGRAASVVGENRQGAGRGEVLPVLASRELLPQLDHGAEVLGLEDRWDVLEDRRHAVEPHPGIDVLER